MITVDSPRDHVGHEAAHILEYHLPATNVAWKAGEIVGMNMSTGIALPLASGLLAMGVVPENAGRDLSAAVAGAERIIAQARPVVLPQDGTFAVDAAAWSPVYWNSTTNVATASSSSGTNPFIGYLIRSKSLTIVHVDIRPSNSVIGAIQADANSAQGWIDLRPQDFYLATGAPLAVFADGASAVPGSALVDSEAFGIRWNNHATPDAVVTSFQMPPDADIAANATVTVRASKTGATLADATTFTIACFNQVNAALHDADSNFGGATDAMTGDAAAKTIQSVTRTLALADLAASPASTTLTLKPTNGTLGTDDVVVHSVRITYKKKALAY